MKFVMKILVAYDGSAYAEKALIEAIKLAKMLKGSITILHVAWKDSDDESIQILDEAKKMLKKENVIYELIIEHGQFPLRRALHIAIDDSYDLIVIGIREFGVGEVWILGSVPISHAHQEVPYPPLSLKDYRNLITC